MKSRKWFWCLLITASVMMFITLQLLKPTRKNYSVQKLAYIPEIGENKRNSAGHSNRKRNFNSTYTMQTKQGIAFTKMKYGPVYILDVAAGNSSGDKKWDIIKIYASIEPSVFRNDSLFRCCLLYKTNNTGTTEFVEKEPLFIRKHNETCWLRAYHFTCSNIRHNNGIVPAGAALTFQGLSCKDQRVVYVPPFYPKKESDTKLAIGTKTAFGDVNAELIIEWMEAYKNLGVDKIVTYYLKSINEPALKVLNHYASTGILDLSSFEPAASGTYPRKFHPPNRQKWNDQRMTIYDSFEKMSGYTYFGIIDHDEFLIPSRNRTLKEMLDDLYQSFPGVTGFTFKTECYYVSWGKSDNSSDTILGAYVNRTNFGPKIDYPKNIYRPALVSPGGVSTHRIEPNDKMTIVPETEGYIRHFRECRPQKRKLCMQLYKRVRDTEMAEWSARIQENVRRARQHIFETGVD